MVSHAFVLALRTPPYIELYMLKREGQGDGGIFINRRNHSRSTEFSPASQTGCLGNSRDMEIPLITISVAFV